MLARNATMLPPAALLLVLMVTVGCQTTAITAFVISNDFYKPSFQKRQGLHFLKQISDPARGVLSQERICLGSLRKSAEETDQEEGKSRVPSKEKEPKNPDSLNKELLKFRRNRRNGAQLAHHRLEVALKENDPGIDEKSFNTVFLAYASQSGRGDWMAPLKAEQLLQKMKRHNTIQPSVFSYNAVMEVWVKSATRAPNPKRREMPGAPGKKQQSRDSSSQTNFPPRKQQRSIVQAKNAVLRLFEEMKKPRRQNQTGLTPDTYSYNLVLELYAKSPNPHDLKKAQEWFLQMGDEPDRQTLHLMFTAHANHGNAEQAEALLDFLIQEYRDFAHKQETLDQKVTEQGEEEDPPAEPPQVPSQVWFHCVLKACVQDNKLKALPETEDRADRLLKKMHNLYQDHNLTCIRPDATTYNHAINVHAQAGNSERVEELLKELEGLYKDSKGDVEMAPDRITYTTALKSYTNNNDSTSTTEKAEALFQRMQDLAAMGRPNMIPSIVTYNTMIQIYARAGIKEELNKATELLKQMQKHSGFPPAPLPNAQSYTAILHGWSRTKYVREAGYKAEELLHQLEQLPLKSRQNLNWTTVYNSAITAWSKSGDKTAPQRVEALLNLLEDKCFASNGKVQPDRTTFLCIADTYAKARIPDAEQRCEDLLTRMNQLEEAGVVSPDLRSSRVIYNSILNALAKSGDPSSKDKAEEILAMMQVSTNINLKPDIVTYATVIDCHTKSGSANTADRAEELLRFVEGSYRSGDALLKPNAVFYSAILQAWAKTATLEGAEKAEWLLRRNEGLYKQGPSYEYTKPHAIMYNAVMDSIARSGMPQAGEKAEELLKEMESLYEAGDVEMKPTRRSFNAVMLAYRQDNDGERGANKAQIILERMEHLADTGDYVNPNVVSYNCAIQAIVDGNEGKSSEERRIAADRAQALLDRMEERSVRPDATTYSCIIEAWLRCNDEKGSVMAELMLKKFLELVESTKDMEFQLDTDAVWNVINAYRDPDEALV